MYIYKDIRDIDAAVLQDLYLSLEWDSGNHPEQLAKAMAGSSSVFTAWDNDRLVGLINVLSDGHMAAYIHYMLVRPECQGRGVGRRLMSMVQEHYAQVPVKVLVAYGSAVGFYERCGFQAAGDKSPMFQTEMRL